MGINYKKSIKILSELRDIYIQLGDTYRVRAYDNALAILNKKSGLVGIGDRIRAKIDAISRGKIPEELIQLRAYVNLIDILGFGRAMVNRLITCGISVEKPEDLLMNPRLEECGIKLNRTQILGLKYYKKLARRIPREIVRKIARELEKIIPSNEFHVVGSFRRKKPDSGDVDILVISDLSMRQIAEKVQDYSRYVDYLLIGPTKMTFLADYSGIVIQVDVRKFKQQEFPAALLYFTGSKEFNTRMRGLAKAKGFLLNEYGLFESKSGNMVKVRDEHDIFHRLGIQYIPPEKRTKDVLLRQN